MHLLDINVWLAMAFRRHISHAAAAAWFQAAPMMTVREQDALKVEAVGFERARIPGMFSDCSLRIAQIVPSTEAEGPGRRFALWFQGCPLRCPGCCNPEMLPFTGGTAMMLGDVVAQIEEAAQAHGIEGITLLGGEPLAHAAGAAALARAVHSRGLSVMVFSGYTLEEARRLPDPAVAELLARTDILVDGPYLREQPETRRRWIGSANQRIHFLSDRYRADDPRWLLPNTLEIRLRGPELTVNGFPARSAVGLWKRPLAKRQ